MKRHRSDLRDLEQRLKEAMRNARQHGGASRINIAGRMNKAVAVNAGGKGSRRAVASSQKIRIKQDPSGTIEEMETRETRGD